jgi:hypothetical protein
MFAGVGGMGTTAREGGDGELVVDAEKEEGEAYGGDSGDVCDWTSGDDTDGEDRFVDLVGHVESLLLSLFIVGETARRTLPLDCVEDGDRTTDVVVSPEGCETRTLEESVPELLTALFSEDKAFDVDGGTGDIVSVRVEDSLEDGELVEGPLLGCCDISEDVRVRLGRGSFGNGPTGG